MLNSLILRSRNILCNDEGVGVVELILIIVEKYI